MIEILPFLFSFVAGDHDHDHADHGAPSPKTMLFHRCHSFEGFGMFEYYNRKCSGLSLSKRTRDCSFRHFSVLPGRYTVMLFERSVELARAFIAHTLRNRLDRHSGRADQLPRALQTLLDQKAVNGHTIGAAETLF